MTAPSGLVLLRGGGDLATGAALRLWRSGIQVVICELPQPLVVRRTVSFAEAVYRGAFSVEGVASRLVSGPEAALARLAQGEIPVLVDPDAAARSALPVAALVDARLRKRPPELSLDCAPLVVGVGPGFTPGLDCHAVVETRRGHTLGRVYWDRPPAADTGVPGVVWVEGVAYRSERLVRAPAEGIFTAAVEIGAQVQPGAVLGDVAGQAVLASVGGVVRGLLHSGAPVSTGLKIGDIDPRGDPAYCMEVSDKSLAVGGGVLEAVLSRPETRRALWRPG